MKLRRSVHAWALVIVGAAFGLVPLGVVRSAWALDSDDARDRATAAIDDAERHIDEVRRAVPRARKRTISAAERVAAGDIMLRTHNYDRAIELFSQVIELQRQGRASAPASADAETLLTESYLKDGQLLSAARHARNLLDRATEPAYSPYAGRALSRLTDVALRTKDEVMLAQAVEYSGRLTGQDATGWLPYAKGKVAFASGDYAAARQALAAVPAGADIQPQAQYLLGVLLTKEASRAADAAAETSVGQGQAGEGGANKPSLWPP